jgi:NAD+ synthase
MTLADQVSAWIGEQVRAAGVAGTVVGLSGGIDSAVVAGLCARAVGPRNTLGVIMPSHSDPADVQDAALVGRTFKVDYRVADLTEAFDLFKRLLPPGTQLSDANLKPRLRMLTLYYYANAMNRLVVGTGNRSELSVGYFTKFGDGGVDILPLGNLYKSQVRELARELGVPDKIIDRAPSAGLWAGQTDEEEMGITYETLDATLQAIAAGDTSAVEPATLERVQRMISASEHKRRPAPIFTPTADA